MKKEKKEKHFIEKPTYPGGVKAMRDFIRQNLKYPGEALAHKIEGSVHCRYEVDYKGRVGEVQVISGLGHGCDEEAIRLIKLMHFTEAKSPKKLRVKFHKTLRIHFRLPKEAKKETPPGINYRYEIKSSDDSSSKNTYTYSIKW